MIDYLDALNVAGTQNRLDALRKLPKDFMSPDPHYVNSHIHTTYSFSPYSPTAAVYAACSEGLATAGIVDHDSIAGAREFIAAGEMLNIPTTIGMECRVSLAGTSLHDKMLNNPDQRGISYITIHGIPHTRIDAFQSFIMPYRELRVKRLRAMADNINELLPQITLNFDENVLPLSNYAEGGGVTERHLMMAFARALIVTFGKGKTLISALENLNVELGDKQLSLLQNTTYPFYEYDILGILKAAFVEKIYIPATEECADVREVAHFSKQNGAIACYPYLGDVGESVTGDKKAQKCEDDYLDEVITVFAEKGYEAVAYMPTRNTPAQVSRLQALCEKYNMFEVSGEDINTPRQSFACTVLKNPENAKLIEATWALIAHERAATQDISEGLLADKAKAEYPNIRERAHAFASRITKA